MDFNVLAPGIILYKADVEECKKLKNNLEETLSNYWHRGSVVNTAENNEISVVESSRSVGEFSIFKDALLNNDNDPIKKLYLEIDSLVSPCMDHYCSYYSIEPMDDTCWVCLKYEKTDKFNWHVDDGIMFPRTVSLSFYVNDDFDGGEIEFQHFNISHKPAAGDIILFSSSYPYMHRVKPVTSGTRYTIVNWYRYKGFPLKKDV
jgi:hypothetical protein